MVSPQHPRARHRPDPPRWPFPWQARRPPQGSRPGCSPRHRPLQDQRVSLRRVNARYVIATSQKVDLAGIDEAKINEIAQPKYFTAEKSKEKAGEEAFFKQGEKPQVRPHTFELEDGAHNADIVMQKKEVSSSRVADQKAIDKALIANIKKVEFLASYLASSFTLRKGDKPHEMKW